MAADPDQVIELSELYCIFSCNAAIAVIHRANYVTVYKQLKILAKSWYDAVNISAVYIHTLWQLTSSTKRILLIKDLGLLVTAAAQHSCCQCGGEYR